MTQYIDKSALVAEIKRLLAFYSKEIESNKEDPWAMDIAKRDILQEILSFLDTLEVKEVDLEKELDEWLRYGPHTNYPWCTIPDAIKITAEHFFELGLNVKGE